MKVTLICPLPPIKSISPYCYHLAKDLSKKVDLEIFSFKSIKPGILYIGGEKEKETKYEKLKKVKIFKKLAWYSPFSWIYSGIKAKGDIVHIQQWSMFSSIIYCIILLIIKIRNKRIVITVHNITPHENENYVIFFDRIFNKFMFKFANNFIVHNKRNKKRIEDLYHIDEKKISIATHGLIKPYQSLKGFSKKESREFFNIPKNKKVILLFGYLWEYKGLDVLLNSLRIIKEEVKDVLLFIAGQPLNNWQSFQKIIEENHLEEYVKSKLDYIHDSEIEYLFLSSDLVVLPYKNHTFDTHGGIGALALSFKKPLVVTDVGGLREYVRDERVISEPNNVEDLANKIIAVLNDKDLLMKLTKDSEDIGKQLTWEKIAEKTERIYSNLK